MGIRRTAAAGALVTGMTLGMRDALGREDGQPVIEVAPDLDDDRDRIVLYLHPDVPEASLVLVRPANP